MKYSEHVEQTLTIRWARLNAGKYPEISLLHSSLNAGKRRPAQAARLKAAGMLAGIPDLFLPVARGGFHGLFIEMKSKGGTVTPIQKKIHEALIDRDYRVVVCYSFEQAKSEIIMYLAMEKS